MKALQFSALHCLLILCVSILPIAGSVAGDDLHHPDRGCSGCEIGPIGMPGDCGGEPCVATTSSCSSHHGLSMIVVAIANPIPELSDGAAIARDKDDFEPPPPSRIDRPPIT